MKRKGKVIEATIQKVEYGGRAIAYDQGRRVVVPQGLPGQKMQMRIRRVKPHEMEAVPLSIINRSPLETEEACPHANGCGGCFYQGVPYPVQLEMKERQVRDLFTAHRIHPKTWLPMIGSPSQFEYRNKMEFSFGNERKGGPMTLGMHQRGRRHDVVDTPGCNLVDRDVRMIRNQTATFFRNKGYPPYQKTTGEGILRHLVVRKGIHTGEILVNLVTTSEPDLPVRDWGKALKELPFEGKLESLLWTRNDQVADAVRKDAMDCVHGKPTIRERFQGLEFTVTPFSFLQPNSEAADQLYELICQWIEKTDRSVYDLYCGLGTISQIVAKKAVEVTGVEWMEESTRQAASDASSNQVTNCRFITGDVKEVLNEMQGSPDVVIVDPPRAGVHPKAMKQILACHPDRLIYVSCNPRSLMENLGQAMEAGWHVDTVGCVDLFPHTVHLETAVLMMPDSRNNAGRPS